MAAAYRRKVQQDKTSLRGSLQFILELTGPHVSSRFDKQELCRGFASLGDLGEKTGRRRHLMYNGKSERKVHGSSQISQMHGIWRTQAGSNTIKHLRPAGPAFQALKHLRLDIDRNHPAGATHPSRQFNGEEAHSRTGFEHRHAFPNVRRQ